VPVQLQPQDDGFGDFNDAKKDDESDGFGKFDEVFDNSSQLVRSLDLDLSQQ
jgi:hypothetical protein